LVLKPETTVTIAGYRVQAVEVSHTIECCAFIVEGPSGAIAYSGDTGPTKRLWEVLNGVEDLRAMLMEVSFPNREQQLATLSGHHTPRTLAAELKKYKKTKDLPFLLYHIKPVFQAEVEKECAKIAGLNLTIPKLGDQFIV
jgi:3',5'-cyclic-nucleotide phosphodiesterase